MRRKRAGVFARAAGAVDRRFGWDRLPWPLGFVVLGGLRSQLRGENLYDTDSTAPVRARVAAAGKPETLTVRTVDGTYNDLDNPAMGSVGSPLRAQRPAGGDASRSANSGCSPRTRAWSAGSS